MKKISNSLMLVLFRQIKSHLCSMISSLVVVCIFYNNFNCKTGNYQSYTAMLLHSNKPQILRLHNLEEKQRNKFLGGFDLALTEILPSSLHRKLRSSLFLTKLLAAFPDIYYTLSTLYYCKRRLGEEYTYIAMYKQKHFNEYGVLLNKKTRLLLFILEIVSRNLLLPLFSKFMDSNAPVFEKAEVPSKTSIRQRFLQRLCELGGRMKEGISRYLGTAEQIMSNVEWLILMVYMLDWNKHFTFIETLLGIRYVYTYKNDQIREVSYAIEGYLLLATFIVKAVKTLYTIFKSKEKKATEPTIAKPKQQSAMQSKASAAKTEKTLCRICYDDIKNKSSTKCGHVFCWTCIIQTLEMSPECPVCRSSCKPRQVVQLRTS